MVRFHDGRDGTEIPREGVVVSRVRGTSSQDCYPHVQKIMHDRTFNYLASALGNHSFVEDLHCALRGLCIGSNVIACGPMSAIDSFAEEIIQ